MRKHHFYFTYIINEDNEIITKKGKTLRWTSTKHKRYKVVVLFFIIDLCVFFFFLGGEGRLDSYHAALICLLWRENVKICLETRYYSSLIERLRRDGYSKSTFCLCLLAVERRHLKQLMIKTTFVQTQKLYSRYGTHKKTVGNIIILPGSWNWKMSLTSVQPSIKCLMIVVLLFVFVFTI